MIKNGPISVRLRKEFCHMSTEERELYVSIIEEAYKIGTTSIDISVESLFSEIKQKLIPVLEKSLRVQKEV